jgi:hypothetical protein
LARAKHSGGKQKGRSERAGEDGGTGKRQGDPEAPLLSTVTGADTTPGRAPGGPVQDRGSGKRQGDSEERLVKRVARKTKAKR